MTETIELENVGPFDRLSIPVPEGGGVVVLQGANGTGKTHAIEAVQALAGVGGKPSVADGAASATVTGLGVRLTVGRKMQRSGELEVSRVEGEDPTLLVDPKIKDPAAADRKRIEALCRIASADADPRLFHDLVGGESELLQLASPDTLSAGNLPELAAKLKRDLEAHARTQEGRAENLRGEAEGYRGAHEGVDLSSVYDEAVLRETAQTAAVNRARCVERRDSADLVLGQAAQARQAIASTTYGGPTVAEALASRHTARDEAGRLRRELAVAEEREVAASAAQVSAESHDRAIVRWTVLVEEAEKVERPSDAELDLLVLMEDEAASSRAHGETVRRALDAKTKAEGASVLAKVADKRSEELRMMSRGVERVLSDRIVGLEAGGLRVEGGRLVLDTDRGVEKFSELSPGERYRIAFDIVISAAGSGGMLAISQEAWEALDPENRAAVSQEARRIGVLVLTAEATSGELRAELST